MAQRTRLPTFWIKFGLLIGLIAIADAVLFMAPEIGLNVGVVTLSLALVLAIASPAVWRNRLGLTALALATLFALIQFERPTFAGFLLFAVAIGVAALSPRAPARDDVFRWAQRLLAAAVKTVWGQLTDLGRLRRAGRRRGGLKVAAVAWAAVLPVVGGVVFFWLFAAANPVIAEAISAFRIPDPDLFRLVFWGVIAFPVVAALRPRGLRRTLAVPKLDGDFGGPIAGPGAIVASLVVFNALFALQNGLDFTYLAADARLPGTLTFAQYAHHGAYPLIATALLAGLFVLVFLQPGSRAAASPLVRGLVVLWVAQNLLLVAFAVVRTLIYVDAYSLSVLRIVALIWMALVAVGLLLICWRLLAGKTGSWLINAGALAAAIVFAVCSVVDLGAIVAAWNVRHAREAGGRGVHLDLCYMRELSGAAVVSLAELERRPIPADLRARVAAVRRDLADDLLRRQGDLRSWRFRDARRLERLSELGVPAVRITARPFDCDGRPIPIAAPAAPLTPPANLGT